MPGGPPVSVDLSAVVITRNEEARIAACLEACLASIRRARGEALIRTAEVILCDSASTDRTVEIARRYPVTIVQLLSTWPLSAAAGRYVGTRHVRGDLVLYVDGDYVLSEDWLSSAIRALRGDPATAAVCGRDIEEFTGDSLLLRAAKRSIEALTGEPEAVPIGLYRREALEAVGGVHPFLKGAEDRDVAHRLRAAGYRLRRLPVDMGVHRWAESGPLDYITYFRSVLVWSLGDGQTVRVRWRSPRVRAETVKRYASVRHLGNHLLGLTLVALLAANVLWALLPLTWPVAVADAAFAGSLLAVGRSRGWTWREVAFEFHVVPYSLIRHAGFLLGFLRRRRDPAEYPTGERVIQSAVVPENVS